MLRSSSRTGTAGEICRSSAAIFTPSMAMSGTDTTHAGELAPEASAPADAVAPAAALAAAGDVLVALAACACESTFPALLVADGETPAPCDPAAAVRAGGADPAPCGAVGAAVVGATAVGAAAVGAAASGAAAV